MVSNSAPRMPSPSPVNLDSSDTADDLNERSLSLMVAVKAGDDRAFEELVRLHQNAVIGTAMRMLGNLEDAHDLGQQVFVRIWKSAARYEPTAKFTTWMFTVLRNLVFNEYRRRGRHPTQSLDADAEEYGHQIEDATTATPDTAAVRSELETAIDEAILSLPEAQRIAVSLRRYEDMPYEEIATILKLSLSAVKSLIFRARAVLREKLSMHLD